MISKRLTCPTEWLTRARPDSRRDFLKMAPMTELRTIRPVALEAEKSSAQPVGEVNARLTERVLIADLWIVRKRKDGNHAADIRG
jgi:hypothetical protein